MKKAYVTPASMSFSFATEGLLAASIVKVNATDELSSTDDILSEGKEWNESEGYWK